MERKEKKSRLNEVRSKIIDLHDNKWVKYSFFADKIWKSNQNFHRFLLCGEGLNTDRLEILEELLKKY